MKYLSAFTVLLAVVSAQSGKGTPRPPPSRPVPRVASNDQNARVLRYDSDIAPDGSYNYAIEIDNGISAQAVGSPRDFGGNPPVVPIVVQGSFGWTPPKGKPISISYIADENGYQPTGDAIPTPPPLPPAIARAFAYVAKYVLKKE